MQYTYSYDKGINDILDDILNILANSGISSDCIFKGGYILSKYIVSDSESRSTSDLDLSISSGLVFDSIVKALKGYLNYLVEGRHISEYKIRKPIKGVRSGSINLYRKKDDNSPSFVYCGIDISIKDTSYGVMKLSDGVYSFSVERMLADKIATLYGNSRNLIRRIRDLYDIFLFNLTNETINRGIVLRALSEKRISISDISTFEKLLCEGNSKIIDSLKSFLISGKRVNPDWVVANDITPDKIISSVLYVLNLLR